MIRRIKRELTLLATFLMLAQGCHPWTTGRVPFRPERKSLPRLPDKDYAARLRKTLEKMQPVDLETRHEVSTILHSFRRIANGKIATKEEKEMAKRWDQIADSTKLRIVSRLEFFRTLPLYLQRKLVDDAFIFAKLDKVLPYNLDETAGTICGEQSTRICFQPSLYGKLQIPDGSQQVAIDPSRPIVAIAAGKTGLLLIDVSSSTTPSYFSDPPESFHSEFTGFVNDVTCIQRGAFTYAIITSTRTETKKGALEIVDITNPFSPSLVNRIDGSYRRLAIAETASLAFSYNETGGTIDTIDISDISSPRAIGNTSDPGNVGDIAFGDDLLQFLRTNGSSTFYRLDTETSGSPVLVWFCSDSSPCGATSIDNQCEASIESGYSYVVRDGDLHNLALTSTGPLSTGVQDCRDVRHNSLAFTDDGTLVIDSVMESTIAGIGGAEIYCEFPTLVFLQVPDLGPASFSPIAQIQIPNPIKGIATRGNFVYVADHKSVKSCKSPDDSLHFRIYAMPRPCVSYTNIAPTIDTLNGLEMHEINELPYSVCGSQLVECTENSQCGTGYCNGGLCAQVPVIDVDVDDEIVLTGSNYWDTNAVVLIQNVGPADVGSGAWVPFEAFVIGDEYCDLSDKIKITVDASVSQEGLKKIKIRNFNTAPKIHTCCNCQDETDSACTFDYMDSAEVLVYFRDGQSLPGFDLMIHTLKAQKGTGGWGDLGGPWPFNGDDEIQMLSTAPDIADAMIVAPPEGSYKFKDEQRRPVKIQISRRDPDDSDAAPNPNVELLEIDDTLGLGSALFFGGSACATADYLFEVCGGYCTIACGVTAAVGILLMLLADVDLIASEAPNGLVLTKSIAEDVLQFGACALPESWGDDSYISVNVVDSVSPLQMEGGLKQRIITKKYWSETCDAGYVIEYRLSERN